MQKLADLLQVKQLVLQGRHSPEFDGLAKYPDLQMHSLFLVRIEKVLQAVQLEAVVEQAAQLSLHFLQIFDSLSKKYPSSQMQELPTKIEFGLQEMHSLMLFPKHSAQELWHFSQPYGA